MKIKRKTYYKERFNRLQTEWERFNPRPYRPLMFDLTGRNAYPFSEDIHERYRLRYHQCKYTFPEDCYIFEDRCEYSINSGWARHDPYWERGSKLNKGAVWWFNQTE